MGGGNGCKSRTAQARNAEKGASGGGGGKDGLEKRVGDTSSKIAEATAERDRLKVEKAARDEAKKQKADKEAKRLAKLQT